MVDTFFFSFYVLLISAPFFLPLLAVRGLKYEASIILTCWIFYRAIESLVFLVPSFLIEYKLDPSQGLMINVYFVSITNLILSITVFCVISIGKKRGLKLRGSSFWVRGIRFSERFILLCTLTLFILYVIFTNGIAVTDPRIAYQNHRVGIGFLWAGYIYASTLWVLVRIVNGRSLPSTFIVYLVFCYFSGSKGLLVASILPFIANPRMGSGIRVKIIFCFAPVAVFGFFVLFDQFSADAENVFIRLGNYFTMFHQSARVFNDYLSGELNFLYGEIFVSNVWQFVPRALYADKPYAWGGTYIVGMYYPGMAETGHTPSFGMYTQSFVDFGFLGAFVELLNFKFIIELVAVYFVALCSVNNAKLYFLSYMILVGVGAFFHLPVIVSLFLTYFLLRYRRPFFRRKESG